MLVLRGLSGGVGTVVGGYLYDWYGGRVCTSLSQAIQVLSMALLGWRRPEVLWLVCVLAGAQSGIVSNTANVVFADYFGLEIVGSIQGINQMIAMAGAALGPVALVCRSPNTTLDQQLYSSPKITLNSVSLRFQHGPTGGALRADWHGGDERPAALRATDDGHAGLHPPVWQPTGAAGCGGSPPCRGWGRWGRRRRRQQQQQQAGEIRTGEPGECE